MLTASQCRVVAYLGDGSVIHADCAREQFSGETLANVDSGLFVADEAASELRPLTAYDVDEWASSDAYEQYSVELAGPCTDRHAIVGSDDGTVYGIYDSEAEAEAALWLIPHGPSCDHCGEHIAE